MKRFKYKNKRRHNQIDTINQLVLLIIVTDEEVSTIIDEALHGPFIKRGSMRLRRLRRSDRLQSLKRSDRLQSLKRSDRLQRLRREDGDTPEGAPEGSCSFYVISF